MTSDPNRTWLRWSAGVLAGGFGLGLWFLVVAIAALLMMTVVKF